MTSRGTPISVSLTTVEISPAPSSGGRNSHLLLTEQVVFLDGNDNVANREEGPGVDARQDRRDALS